MPPVKTKEDTWKTNELEKQIRGSRDTSRGPVSKQRESSKQRGVDDRGSESKKKHSTDRGGESRTKHTDDKGSESRTKHSDDRDVRRSRDSAEKEGYRRSSQHGDNVTEERKRREERKHRETEDDRRQKERNDQEKKHRSQSKHTSNDKDRDKDKHREKDRDIDRDKNRDKDRGARHTERDKTHRSRDEDEAARARRKDREREKESEKDSSRSKHGSSRTHGESGKEKRRDGDSKRSKEDRGVGRSKKESDSQEGADKKNSPTKVKEEKDYDYEDDFEDYADDFDEASDDDEKRERSRSASPANPWQTMTQPKRDMTEAELMMEAMNKENERMKQTNKGTSNKQRSTVSYADGESERDADVRGWTSKNVTSDDAKVFSNGAGGLSNSVGGFINFMSAKKQALSQGSSGRVAQRARDLLKIIERDINRFDMYERQPENEYDLFIRNFGCSNAKQVYVQTNDDTIDRELQTEEIEVRDRWSQHPPAAGLPPVGGDGEKDENEDKPLDSIALSSFLNRTSQVMCAVLEENSADVIHKKVGHKQSNTVISEAFVEFGTSSLLQGRHVLYSQFSPSHNQLLLSAYTTSDKPHDDTPNKEGIVCVWNIYEPHRPQNILICQSQPNCCCFSPYKPNLVFAGMTDGSVALWDVREGSSLHQFYRDTDDNEFLLRHTTYDTAGVLRDENHKSCVVALSPIVSTNSGESSTEESLSFQLATLEVESTINIWVVIELTEADIAGSQSDLGLSPGGRVKLIRSSSINLVNPLKNVSGTFRCTDLKQISSNSSQFFVSTSAGCVLHALRYGGFASPRAYRADFDCMLDVTSLDFSPFHEQIFLAGCGDGSLRLYHTDRELPLITWSDACKNERGVKLVRWCRSRPSVFFVLDEHSYLYIWDLQMDRTAAIKREKISKSRVTSLCLSDDHSSTGKGLAGRAPQMVIFLDNGTAESHIIKGEFSALLSDELDHFNTFIRHST